MLNRLALVSHTASRNSLAMDKINELAKQKAKRFGLALSTRLEEVKAFHFPNDKPKEIITVLHQATQRLNQKLKHQNDIKEMNNLANLFILFCEYLSYFEHTTTEETPRSIIYLIELIKCQLQSDKFIIAGPQYKYDYSVTSLNDIKVNIERHLYDEPGTLENLFPKIFDDMYIVNFPKIERDNILNHVIIGHELGHAIADEFLNNESNKKTYTQTLNKIKTNLSEHLNQENEPEINLEIFTKTREMRNRGLQEILSDIVCTLIFGPSALFCLFDVIVIGKGDPNRPAHLNYDYYPPAKFRIRKIYNLLKDKGMIQALHSLKNEGNNDTINNALSHLDHIECFINDETDIKNIKTEAITKLSYDWLESTLEEAINFIEQKIQSTPINATLITKQTTELVARLQNGLPPNEIGNYPTIEIPDWRIAILAGWLVNLSDDPLNKFHINKLVMQAIEYIVISNSYQEHIKKS